MHARIRAHAYTGPQGGGCRLRNASVLGAVQRPLEQPVQILPCTRHASGTGIIIIAQSSSSCALCKHRVQTVARVCGPAPPRTTAQQGHDMIR
jgi:hypothetical protein